MGGGRGRAILLVAVVLLATSGFAAWSMLPDENEPEERTDGPDPDAPEEALSHFDVWGEVADALRTSPDHRLARAEELVAEGDASAILAFVQEEIRVVPPDAQGWVESASAMRWGAHATLRGGEGTPREKAELLATLLERAGFPVEHATTRAGLDTARFTSLGILGAAAPSPFAPELPPDRVDAWAAALGAEDAAEAAPGSTSRFRAASDDVAARLRATLAAGDVTHRMGRLYFHTVPPRLPVVLVTVGNETLLADPLVPGVPLGETAAASPTTEDPRSPSRLLDVEVALRARWSNATDEPVTLVEAAWTADEVVGRDLVPAFDTDTGLLPLLAAEPKDFTTFVPTLTLVEPDGTPVSAVAGEPMSLWDPHLPRARITASIANLENATAAVERVTDVRLVVDNATHPRVRVLADLLDADGTPVEGLPAAALRVREDGEGTGFLLRRNDAVPRILILADTSLSMPSAYRGDALEEFVDGLTEDVRTAVPEATVDLWRVGSNLWTEAARAAGSGATVVVYATDADATDEATEVRVSSIHSGPPFIMLDVYEDGHEYHHRIARGSGGVVVNASDRDAARAAVVTHVEAQHVPAYEILYVSDGGPGTHEVTVSVPATGASGTATYRADAGRFAPATLIGLDLAVTVGGTTHVHSLAGWDGRLDEEALTPSLTRRLANETRGALLGATTLRFEAGAPSPSILLEEHLRSRAAREAFHAAARDGNLTTVHDALQSGLRVTPPELLPLLQDLPGRVTPDAAHFTTGLTVVAVSERLDLATGGGERRVDVMPLAGHRSAARDRDVAFNHTLNVTAQIGLREAALFPTTTASLLAEEPLVAAWSENDFVNLTDEQDAAWEWLTDHVRGSLYHAVFLAPEDGGPLATWVVDRESGEVVAALPDGTGGGARTLEVISEIRRQLEHIATACDIEGDVGLAESALTKDRVGMGIGLMGGATDAQGAVISVGCMNYGLWTLASLLVANLADYEYDLRTRLKILQASCEVLDMAEGLVGMKHIGLPLAADVGRTLGILADAGPVNGCW